jgi:hypothetical protein
MGQLNLLGERLWVHKRFHDNIAAADIDAGFSWVYGSIQSA